MTRVHTNELFVITYVADENKHVRIHTPDRHELYPRAPTTSKSLQDACKELQDASKNLQEASKSLQDAPKSLQETSKIFQDTSKDLQDASQIPHRTAECSRSGDRAISWDFIVKISLLKKTHEHNAWSPSTDWYDPNSILVFFSLLVVDLRSEPTNTCCE